MFDCADSSSDMLGGCLSGENGWTQVQAVRDIIYDFHRYQQYEGAHGADDAKKVLEMASAARVIDKWQIGSGKSLDVGCATGRYPLWLAERGFEATGYDKSAEAIRICNSHRPSDRRNSHVTFKTEDILTSELPHDDFSLITSMMGTFNHLAPAHHAYVLRKYFQGLTPGGGLILSCWNPGSAYLDFLSLYSPDERLFLLRNSLSCGQMSELARDIGYSAVTCEHFCALPDACYDSWDGYATPTMLANIDEYLIGTLGLCETSQMYLLVARKP